MVRSSKFRTFIDARANVQVIFVSGRICSGKDTFCQQLVLHKHIVVSDIVRRIVGEISRSKLQDTGHLDIQISEALLEIINSSGPVVIDGIRQPTILQYVIKHLPSEASWELLWLEVSDEERRRRYMLRADSKDKNEDFDAADQKDIALGLDALQAIAITGHLNQMNINILKNE